MSKKINQIGAFLLGGGVLYWIVSTFTKQTIENVYKFTYKLGKVKFDNSKSAKDYYSNLYFNAELLINNPTPTQLTINSVAFDFYSGGQKIGDFVDNKSFVILPNTTTIKNIVIQINTANVTSSLITAIKSKSISIDYVGLIKTTGVAIKYNDTFKLL
jgi:LEA14-like dessication related protein